MEPAAIEGEEFFQAITRGIIDRVAFRDGAELDSGHYSKSIGGVAGVSIKWAEIGTGDRQLLFGLRSRNQRLGAAEPC